MSRTEWGLLFLICSLYMGIGGLIFYEIESAAEAERRQEAAQALQKIQVLVDRELTNGSLERLEVLSHLSDFCGKQLINSSSGAAEEETPVVWNYYNSFFVALTIVTSIGYGNLAPTTTASRLFCIVYLLFGIPLNGLLLAGLGEYFSKKLLRAHHRYKEAPEVAGRCGLLLRVIQYLTPGIAIFFLLPAVVFSFAEGWSYEDSVYFSFVTLSTVGFGDFVPGHMTPDDAWKTNWNLLAIYRVFIVLWIFFGLGYLAMILSFITRALCSSRLRHLEERVAQRVKNTHARIWQGASRDLRYLRRVLNELYLLKFKPIYRGRAPLDSPHPWIRGRSNSLPGKLPSETTAKHQVSSSRGRSTSESGRTDVSFVEMPRPLSETCLDMIDRDATFAAATHIDASELLATMVDIIESAAASEIASDEGKEGAYHGLSDGDILAGEAVAASRRSSSTRSRSGGVLSRAGSVVSNFMQSMRRRSRTSSLAPTDWDDVEIGSKANRHYSQSGKDSPISLRKVLAKRALSRDSTTASLYGTPALSRVERPKHASRDLLMRRRSEGVIALSKPPQVHRTGSQLDGTILSDLLKALQAVHSRPSGRVDSSRRDSAITLTDGLSTRRGSRFDSRTSLHDSSRRTSPKLSSRFHRDRFENGHMHSTAMHGGDTTWTRGTECLRPQSVIPEEPSPSPETQESPVSQRVSLHTSTDNRSKRSPVARSSTKSSVTSQDTPQLISDHAYIAHTESDAATTDSSDTDSFSPQSASVLSTPIRSYLSSHSNSPHSAHRHPPRHEGFLHDTRQSSNNLTSLDPVLVIRSERTETRDGENKSDSLLEISRL